MYQGLFNDKESICREFSIDGFDGAVVYADYDYEDYSGDAAVLYVREGTFYFVQGSHCSCYGLEGQWAPEEMTLDMLRHLSDKGWGKTKLVADEGLRAIETLNLDGLTGDNLMVALRLYFG